MKTFWAFELCIAVTECFQKSWNFKIKITSQKSYKGHLSLQVVSAQLFMDDFGAWIILVEPQNPFSNALLWQFCKKPSKYWKINVTLFLIPKILSLPFWLRFRLIYYQTNFFSKNICLLSVFSIAIWNHSRQTKKYLEMTKLSM